MKVFSCFYVEIIAGFCAALTGRILLFCVALLSGGFRLLHQENIPVYFPMSIHFVS